MRSPRQDAVWMGAAFAAELAAAVAVLAVLGTQKRGIDAGLAATARVSFLFFWLAYSGGALTTVFGPLFQPIKARGREFGLAFAAAHLVHMGLVVWLCAIGETPAIGVFLFFGTALVFTYALALFSIGAVQASLNPNLWWLLRVVGMNFIAYAFAVDFFRDPLDTNPKHVAEYVPFLVLSAAGPALRGAAIVKKRWGPPRPSVFVRNEAVPEPTLK